MSKQVVERNIIKRISDQSVLVQDNQWSFEEESQQASQICLRKESLGQKNSRELGYDFDSQSHSTETCIEDLNKKRKKKEYKRRKRQKMRRDRENILEETKKIMTKIYQQKTKYENEAMKLQQLFEMPINLAYFYQLVNDVIREHIDSTKKSLWESIQAKEWKEPINFQVYFIKLLYQNYHNLKKASNQIQTVIDLFTHKKKLSKPDYHHDLGSNTFNYMLKHDTNIKRLFFDACQRFLIDDDQELNFKKQKIMLNTMIQALDDEILSQFDLCDQDQSEGLQQEDKQKHKKKKTKKRKVKDYQNEPSVDSVIRRMQSLEELSQIIDDRLQCHVTEEWVEKLENWIDQTKKAKNTMQ